MFRRILSVTLVLLMLFMFLGCEKSPTGTEMTSDESAIMSIVVDDARGYFSYDDHYSEQDLKTEDESKAELKTTWWRQPMGVDEIDITVNVDTLNDSAYVIVSGEVSGIFHVYQYDTIPPDTVVHFEKTMQDYLIRYAVFKQYPDSIGYRGWRLEKISGVNITSIPNTVEIDSVGFECESYPNKLIVDPLELIDKEDVLNFSPGEEVSITIYTDDDIYAFFHARGYCFGMYRWWRWELSEIDTGVWNVVWVTPEIPRIHRFAFDILHKSTIDDEGYQYDSNAWVFPYIIE